jgi:hypothetical protein
MACYYIYDMQLRALIVVAAATVLLGVALASRPAGPNYKNTIVDVSWPNCGKTPGDVFATGILGVNGGLDFHPNPCLGTESTWFSQYAVYMNTGYPGKARARKFMNMPRHCGFSDSVCLAYNYGFNAALYSIKYANLQNVHPNMWWLDVETENSWSDNFLANRQFLKGAEAAIKKQFWSPAVGIYSAPLQWDQIVGPWHDKLPVWLATGGTSKATAANACHEPAFTGGNIWLTQYTIKFDQNFACSNQFTHHVTSTWRARRDSNPRPLVPETNALSS